MRRSSEDDWEDDSYGDYDDDFQSENDKDSDEDDTVTCPSCGASMYEDSLRCPACGEFPSREQFTPTKPPWIVLTGFLCLLIVLSWFLLL